MNNKNHKSRKRGRPSRKRGRPALGDNKLRAVWAYIKLSEVAQLDAVALKRGMSRSQYVANLIRGGLKNGCRNIKDC